MSDLDSFLGGCYMAFKISSKKVRKKYMQKACISMMKVACVNNEYVLETSFMNTQ